MKSKNNKRSRLVIGTILLFMVIFVLAFAFIFFLQWKVAKNELDRATETYGEILSTVCSGYFENNSGEAVPRLTLGQENNIVDKGVSTLKNFYNYNYVLNTYIFFTNGNGGYWGYNVGRDSIESISGDTNQLCDEFLQITNGEVSGAYAAIEEGILSYGTGIYSNGKLVGLLVLDLSEEYYLYQILSGVLPNIATMIVSLAALLLVLYGLAKRYVFRPLQTLETYMTQVSETKQSSDDYQAERYRKEIDSIRQKVSMMSGSIGRSISNIERIVSDSVSRETELNIAKSIQNGFLPPSDNDDYNYHIQAYIRQVSNVGGDLYEYFSPDENHLCLAIGDVSGHGMSAALFMTRVSSALRHSANLYSNPSDILSAVNNEIYQRNPEGIFLTVFVAVIDKHTGELTYSCGGHNPPYLISDKVTKLDDNSGTILGVFPDEKYTDSKIKLTPGCELFLYTDGITEAYNAEKHFYGEERLETVLKRRITGTRDQNICLKDAVMSDLEAFLGNQPEQDDITLLTLTVVNHRTFDTVATVGSWLEIKRYISEIKCFSRETLLEVCLIAEELMANIISYAYPSDMPVEEKKVSVEISFDTKKIALTFRDYGVPFNQQIDFSMLENYDPLEQTGGAGRYLVAIMSDSTDYKYENGQNIFSFTKNVQP